MRARRGFSISELLIVLTIMGLLVRLGMPRYGELRRQAEARAIIGDIQSVRVAAYNYNTEHQSWPGNASAGAVPKELVALLPVGFTFKRPTYTMDWEVWNSATISKTQSSASVTVGLTVDSQDKALVNALRNATSAGIPYIVSGSQTTFLLAGFGGNY
jgi:prepilin-type N-terminal cleavage/methylation domain-containing protein